MAKHVRLIETEVINFAGLRAKKVEYGDVTRLSGRNGQGKTSIGTAPVWTLYGTDLFGNKYNPSPTNYEFDRVYASTILQVDGVPIKFAREIENGTNSFYINDVPTKAKEFEAAVAELFDKDEFLSFYNPIYFFGRHWTKQREQIMKYTTQPAKKEVFQEMSRTAPDQKPKEITLNPAAEKLNELMKKHTLDDLQKIHGGTGGQKSKLEKQHIAAQSRTKTLQEQLDKLPASSGENIESLQALEAELREQIKVADELPARAYQIENQRREIANRLQFQRDQIAQSKERFMVLHGEKIEDRCPTCEQSLDENAVAFAQENKDTRVAKAREAHQALIAKRDEIEAELSAAPVLIDVGDLPKQVREFEDQLEVVMTDIRNQNARAQLEADVAAAKQAEADTLTSLKESVFILDAIKSYKAKEAELQASKVQSLFTTLTIRLFKFVKTKGEYEPDFSIQMDGKDYLALSTGERIEAGLELTEVLFKQSELIVPTFIDNIESYTGRFAVYDQLITGRVVEDQELKIEAEVALR
ncbi:ATPase [Paenibacillus xylanexedens]|uniref:ATPase n=1 Tax=Paenibacillus xylanexedens TaxID=528191 RepID=UPI001F42AB96|nr:ATPase [Paenibacillus xylanexedens]MCF7753402.1 ATPase [Paenibacillus xylanexedens]